MSALFTALVESESKESLANMVCELRAALHLVVNDPCSGLLSSGTRTALTELITTLERGR